MTDEEERQAILPAMQRLFAGTPLQSSGNLDIVALADEAGLKRNKLTHKHPDLKDQFYAERPSNVAPIRPHGSPPRTTQRPHDRQ